MDITPEKLKQSFDLQNDAQTNAQLVLINRYRKVLDEVENSIRMRGVLRPHPLVWRFSFWNPIIDKNGEMQIWNPKDHRHGVSPDLLKTAKTNLKAVGTVQFFRDGTVALDTVKMISPRLIELVDSAESARDMLAAHCARLKDRARINAVEAAIPYIQDALQHLQPNEDPSSIYNFDLAHLFLKHLGGAIDIKHIFNHGEEPANAWAKAAFTDLLHSVRTAVPLTYSYSMFVEKSIKNGIAPPNLIEIPLSMDFGSHPRIKRVAVSNLLRDRGVKPASISDLVPYRDESSGDSISASSSLETSPSSGPTSLSLAPIVPTASSLASSFPIAKALKRARAKAASSSDNFTASKRRSL